MIKVLAKFEPEDSGWTIWPDHTYIGYDEEEGTWLVGPYWSSEAYPEDEYPEGMEVNIGSAEYQQPIMVSFSRDHIDNPETMYDGEVFTNTGTTCVHTFLKDFFLVPRVAQQDHQFVVFESKNKNYKLIPYAPENT